MALTHRALSYIRFFIERRKLGAFFGRELISYTSVVFILFAAVLFFYDRIATTSALAKMLVLILLVIMHCGSLATLIYRQLSPMQHEYLGYIGFQSSDTCFLIRSVAVPINLSHTLIYSTILMGFLTLPLTILCSFAVFAIAEFLSPYIVQLYTRYFAQSRNQNKKTKGLSRTIRMFPNPYRAFLTKDIREAKLSTRISFVFMVVFCLGIMLFSDLGNTWLSFCVCLSISTLLIVYQCGISLFSNEMRAYHTYYGPILGMQDIDLLLYKQPLQLILLFCSVFVFTIVSCTLFGFDPLKILIAVCIFIYSYLTSCSMNWIYIKRIKKRKAFDSIYQLVILPIISIPFLSIVSTLISIITERLSCLNDTSKERIEYAEHF